ncbi:MAG TPA: hypothetical protein VL614_15205 [Acetobacteraceae bacterium]|jgi:hypothetical protein|nr:hypothetical protein [Acetobacteraceae bacterium]
MADDAASWTIKSMPIETRQRAVKAAHAQDQTMAEWMVDAVNRLADQQAGNQVIPPGKPDPQRRAAELPDIDLQGLANAISATVGAIQAAGGKPPLSLGRDASATLRLYMRAARGLPEKEKGQGRRPGKLIGQNGQTDLENRQTWRGVLVEEGQE